MHYMCYCNAATPLLFVVENNYYILFSVVLMPDVLPKNCSEDKSQPHMLFIPSYTVQTGLG